MHAIGTNPFNRNNLVGEILNSWQGMLDLAAELIEVPAGLITRIDGAEIEIFLSSRSQNNPYSEGYKTQYPNSGFYCEWVAKNRQPLLVPNARADPLWKDNAAVAMNMVSYLGMPILRPDGEVFGTVCFLDAKENSHTQTILKLADQFKRMIELSLSALCTKEELRQKDRLFEDLSRIFPICSYCKKVRNETNEWIPVEKYIQGVSGRFASHGICPRCYDRVNEQLGMESDRNG